MTSIKNLSSDFNTALKTASQDKIINKTELETLKSKAKTDDDKAVVEILTKDSKNVSFNINEGNAQTQYDLSIDNTEIPAKQEKDDTIKLNDSGFNPSNFNFSYSNLGVGSKGSANVTSKPDIIQPTGNLNDVAKTFNTPDKVAGLLGSINYDNKRAVSMNEGPLGTQKPEDTLKSFSGVCRDTHQLGAYLLSQNGYDAVQMGYVSARTSHSITVYKEPDGKGYGIVEYGKVYSPEKIKEMMGGRYASSPEEALNALNMGTATTIYKWTPPKEGQEGNVAGAFYTSKFQNYHKTLKLEHKDGIVFDRELGLEIEKTLGEKFSMKAGINFGSPADPTSKDAIHATVGYKTGNEENWFSASVGTQYRPNDGSRIVGTTDFVENPTLLAGADIRGQWTPLKHSFNQNHHTSTVASGNLSGAFLAINGKEESDAGQLVSSDKKSFDMDYISGLPSFNLGVEQRFYGNITPNLSYNVTPFADYNAGLAVAGISMGGGVGDYTNLGVKGSMTYKEGKGEVSVGGQYMLKQVDNLHNTGLGVQGKYNITQNLNVFGGASVVNSVEGNRFMFSQGIGYNLNDKVSFDLSTRQEVGSGSAGMYMTQPGLSGRAGVKINF